MGAAQPRTVAAAVSRQEARTDMKGLATGACGQGGSHVTELLLARGDDVCGIDNLATGRREHLPEHPRLKLTIDTIADRRVVETLFDGFRPEAVVHTAASYKDPEDWHGDAMTNCVGGVNI